MNKHFAISHKYASVIYNNLCIKSNCFKDKRSKVISADYVIAVDDDATSAFGASYIYHSIYAQHGFHPIVLCVGGYGILSKHLYDTNEAEMLAYVCKRLGVNEKHIILVPNGNNCGANVQEVKKIIPSEKKAIWCLTKRLSLRMERTITQQAPNINSYYYVIDDSLDDAAKIMSGKGLAKMEPLFHELAGTLERCINYAETYQAPITGLINITPEIIEADAFLRKHYRLKLMKRKIKLFGYQIEYKPYNLKSIFQLIRLHYIIKKTKPLVKENTETEIINWINQLHRKQLLPAKHKSI